MTLKKIYLALLIVLFAECVYADDTRSIVVGVEDSQYFPHYAVRDGEWIGFGAALLRAFGASSNYQFEFRAMPVERLYRQFLTGEVDLKYPDNPEWRKELKSGKAVFYSDPIVEFIDGVSVTREKLGQGIESISSLGTIRGFTPVSWSKYIQRGQVKIQENDSFEGLIKQTLMGRVDGIYANVDVVQQRLLEVTGNTEALKFDQDLPFLKAHYRLSSTVKPRIISIFNQWMRENSALISDLKSEFFRGSR